MRDPNPQHWRRGAPIHQTCSQPSMGRIAIVDDSEDALELFALILRDENEYLTFLDGAAFVREFRRGFYDLILLDLVMPETDGFAVFHDIRRVDPDVPVVAETAAARPEERAKALAMGFCDYFIKPILELQQFRAAVHSHIRKCANSPPNAH